jgi:hypothetical protein
MTIICKNLIYLLTLSAFISIIPFSDALAETMFFINYYAVGQDAYNGETPLNGVIRIPDDKMESDECIESIKNIKSKKSFEKCKPLTAELLKAHGKRVAELLDFDNEVIIRKIATIEIGNNGKGFLYVGLLYGGSGGGMNDWSLYLIRKDKDKYRQTVFRPNNPFLSGIEVSPGGNVWYEMYCGKQEYEKCAERIFYPKQNAFQMLFTDKGVITQPLPLDEKNPK